MKIKGDPQWTIRRRVIVSSLTSCLGLSIYAVAHSPEMAAAVLPHTALLSGAIIGSYVFGAAWERTAGVPGGNSVSDPAYQGGAGE